MLIPSSPAMAARRLSRVTSTRFCRRHTAAWSASGARSIRSKTPDKDLGEQDIRRLQIGLLSLYGQPGVEVGKHGCSDIFSSSPVRTRRDSAKATSAAVNSLIAIGSLHSAMMRSNAALPAPSISVGMITLASR